MSMETEDSPTIRQEHLQNLAPFCHDLRETLIRAGLGPDEILAAFRITVAAECVGCGIHISGEELFALSQPPSADQASVKIGRLRLGDCARQGCDSFYYRINLHPYPGVNWPKLLSEVENRPAEQPAAEPAQVAVQTRLLRVSNSRLARRVGIVLAAGMLLLIARQFYVGGRIPFLREPEHFRVDPDPNEELSK